jgi:hypothetical protein
VRPPSSIKGLYVAESRFVKEILGLGCRQKDSGGAAEFDLDFFVISKKLRHGKIA